MTTAFYNTITPHMAAIMLQHYAELLAAPNKTPAAEVFLRRQCRYYKKML